MREIRIVITDTSVSFPDGQELGRVGEHNATQLLIELPAEMVEGIDYHIIKFSLLGGAITSDIITEDDSKQIYISDGKIYCTLWQQLTASRGLSFTVEAYKVVDGSPKMIAKSPLVSGLRFDLSADAGAEVDEQGYSLAVHVNALDERVTDTESDVAALEEDSHTHTNKSLLDTYTQTETDIADAVEKTHTHPNQAVLDEITEVHDSTKVDKETGKGLSTNDLSDALKASYDGAASNSHTHPNKSTLDNTTAEYTTAKDSKLSGIATGAQVNVLESVKYNGTAVAVTDKAVDIAPNKFATPALVRLTPYGSIITLESNKEYNISLADDAEIILPPAPGTTYSGTILLCLTCTADINLTFDASVKLDSGVSTVTGYHEILITFHPGEGKWWVRQTPEVT